MSTPAAVSTHAVAAEAASVAFHVEGAEAPATAVDGLIAGVLALAASRPSVLLGAGTLLLGGAGEGLQAIDARARQPGLGAPRPRGFTDAIPDAAFVAAPLLPDALAVAHAGRGNRTRTALVNAALSAARAHGKVDDARVESLKAWGREGGAMVRSGPVRDALLAAAARSLGGLLTDEDLAALRPELVPAAVIEIESRRWAFAPWREGAPDQNDLAIVATCDAHGVFAVAAVVVDEGVELPEVGLSVPKLARPVLRGVTREAAGAPLPIAAPIGVSQARSVDGELGPVSLAAGGPRDALFAELVSDLGAPLASIDEAIGKHAGTVAVLRDARGRGRSVRA